MRSPFHTHFKTMRKHLFSPPCPFVHLSSLYNSFTQKQLLMKKNSMFMIFWTFYKIWATFDKKYYFTRRTEYIFTHRQYWDKYILWSCYAFNVHNTARRYWSGHHTHNILSTSIPYAQLQWCNMYPGNTGVCPMCVTALTKAITRNISPCKCVRDSSSGDM